MKQIILAQLRYLSVTTPQDFCSNCHTHNIFVHFVQYRGYVVPLCDFPPQKANGTHTKTTSLCRVRMPFAMAPTPEHQNQGRRKVLVMPQEGLYMSICFGILNVVEQKQQRTVMLTILMPILMPMPQPMPQPLLKPPPIMSKSVQAKTQAPTIVIYLLF